MADKNNPPPAAQVQQEARDMLRIVDTAIIVCNERDRPAMAESLEAVRHYIERATHPSACELGAVLERCARDLPDGVEVQVIVEAGSACVMLAQHGRYTSIDGADQSLSEQVEEALATALQHRGDSQEVGRG